MTRNVFLKIINKEKAKISLVKYREKIKSQKFKEMYYLYGGGWDFEEDRDVREGVGMGALSGVGPHSRSLPFLPFLSLFHNIKIVRK